MTVSTGKVVFDVDAQKAYKAAQNLSKEFAQVGKTLASSVAGVMALAGMIDRATDATMRLRDAAAASNRELGGAALTRGAAVRQMGASPQAAKALEIIGQTGAVSETEQATFLQALAKSGGRRMGGAASVHYAQAYATGAFSQEELLDAAKRGRKVDISARMAKLSPAELDEIAMRVYELDQKRREAGEGRAERLALIERERQRRDSPGLSAFVEGVEGTPIIGGLVREASMDRMTRSFTPQNQRGNWIVFDYSRPMPVTPANEKPQPGAKDAVR